MDGIINFNKPLGITSAKALYRVRALTRQRKSGHAGTLDPAASGVLVLCLGRATKLVEQLMDQSKVYRTTARLDVTSESFDADRPLRDVRVTEIPSLDEVSKALTNFEGTIQQVPPNISAIKLGGVPAYKRKPGEVLTLAPRAVTIYWIVMNFYEWPVLDFEMCCGRGTYVRSLIRDLGEKLGTGGCLTSLRREQVGPFHVTEAWTLEQLAAHGPAEYLIPPEQARDMLARASIPERPLRRDDSQRVRPELTATTSSTARRSPAPSEPL